MSLNIQLLGAESKSQGPACHVKPVRTKKHGRTIAALAVFACIVGPCCWPLIVPLLATTSGATLLVFLGDNWEWITLGNGLVVTGVVLAFRRLRKRGDVS